MLNIHRNSGFTLVEMMVVIVVIVILAAITMVSYRSVQDRAMDAKILTVLDDAGKALEIEELKGNQPTSAGYWGNTGGVDSILESGYVQRGYRNDLKSKNVNANSRIFRYYRCNDGFALFASLNQPSSEDIANLATVKSQCNISNTYVPISGDVKYNYGKIF